MEILVIREILTKISEGKMTPLDVYVDQKSLVFPGLKQLVNMKNKLNSIFKFITFSPGIVSDAKHTVTTNNVVNTTNENTVGCMFE